MQYFEIAFCGEILPGAELEQVKAAIAALFKADEALLNKLFCGQRMVIKQRLDAQSAAKYQAAFQRAGAVLEVRELANSSAAGEALSTEPSAPRQTQQESAAHNNTTTTGPAMLQVAPRDEYMAAFRDVQAPDFGLAPLGDDLQPTPVEKSAPELDLSAMSLAPVGSDMGQLPSAPASAVPDTSHIQLADKK